MKNDQIDKLRENSLESIERSEQWFYLSIVACAIAELAGLICVFWFMDWTNETHKLIFSATMLVYLTLALLMLAVSNRSRIGEQRILLAIELLQEGRYPQLASNDNVGAESEQKTVVEE